MNALTLRPSIVALACSLIASAAARTCHAQDISSSPSSLRFQNTYVGRASGNKVLTITKVSSANVTISTVSFSCPGFGLASGIVPFSLGATQTITHYSVFFQPTAAQSYNCNFVLNMKDGTSLSVPITAKGLSSKAKVSVSPTSLSFSNKSVGVKSPGQTVTITNTGAQSVKLEAITPSSPSFTIGNVTLPVTIASNGTFSFMVYYTPSQLDSEAGALDLGYDAVPDNGVSLTANAVAPGSLKIATSPTLPQATQNAAYQATLSAVEGKAPYTWNISAGSLPKGVSLSSSGIISGTLGSAVTMGNHTFSVKVTDAAGSTASKQLTLGVYANLGDDCNDISYNIPGASSPLIALNDLGTGTFLGSEGGLYPSGSNSRPASHDADGVSIAQSIQPLDSDGNPDPNGKYVLMAIGESTAQQEFSRFLPIANADPQKNPALVLVNGAQGGGTPNNFQNASSSYWSTVLNNYLPQNGVTAQQIVAIWLEDTDGIATGTFPSDVTTLQSEYETMMQTMLTLFPNLKLVYFSSRVYGGYSNGVGKPDNPEPYAYEVGFAVKWAIEDQLNGKASLNYDSTKGPVVAPWMSWGPYYWSNGMLGRSDGTIWDCEDFSSDGTHPSSSFGQLKVATPLLNFLKTDDTTTPWYLAH